MEGKGRLLIKFTGVLLLIGGVLNTLVGILGFFGGGAAAIYGSKAGTATAGQAAAAGGILIAYSLVCIVYGVIAILAGINGVKYSGDIRKAEKCFKLGVILVIVDIIIAVLSLILDGFSATIITGLIVPILYMVAADQCKKGA